MSQITNHDVTKVTIPFFLLKLRDGKIDLKFISWLSWTCLGLLQLLFFWLILKTMGTSANNAAEFVMLIADPTQSK